jgi:hypothetical protein
MFLGFTSLLNQGHRAQITAEPSKDSKTETDKKQPMQQTTKPRLYFVDNLRTFVIILFFLVHIAITYGDPADPQNSIELSLKGKAALELDKKNIDEFLRTATEEQLRNCLLLTTFSLL